MAGSSSLTELAKRPEPIYPKNPSYGSGAFRRRITFSYDGMIADLTVYDDFHDMHVCMTVSDNVVSAIDASMRRYPKTTCPGAVASLSALVGAEVSAKGTSHLALNAGEQCTHLLQLAALGLTSLARGSTSFTAEIVVYDLDEEDRQTVTIELDGQQVFKIRLHDNVIVEPIVFNGRRLFGGFGKWVAASFEGMEADLWRMAQISVFVATGRKWIVDGTVQRRVGEEPSREGVCHSYSRPAFPDALAMVNYVRDHSDGLPPLEDSGPKSR